MDSFLRRLALALACAAVLVALSASSASASATINLDLEAFGYAWYSSNPTFVFRAQDADSGDLVHFECSFVAGSSPSWAPCGFGSSGSFTPSPPAADGDYQFRIQAHDDFGNSTLGVMVFVKLDSLTSDSVAPVVTLSGPAGGLTNNPSPHLTYGYSEQHPQRSDCKLDDGDWKFCYEPIYTGLADGPHTVQMKFTDFKGNVGYASTSFTVDTIPPALAITSPAPGQVVGAEVPDINIAVIGGTAVCRYDEQPFAPCDAAFAAQTLPDGLHILTVRATDPAGNVVERAVAFTIDASLGAPPKPQTATFTAGKAKKGKSGATRRALKVIIVPPDGAQPAAACQGRVTLSITGKAGKKTKTFQKQTDMEVVGNRCAASATFTLPKKFRKQKLNTKISFAGNRELGEFAFTGTIKN